jgi:glycosyltransferase involved in cell wall biosynthesis
MKILIGQNHLDTIGGSETFTYALVEELVRRGHDVSLLLGTNRFGEVSNRISRDFGIEANKLKGRSFDVAFLNHTTTIKRFFDNNLKAKEIYQICHGTVPELEQPYGHPLLKYIAISDEVREHLKKKGFDSVVIKNGINTKRFCPTGINEELKNVLSLSQSDKFNVFLEKICKKHNLNFMSHNKFMNPVFEIEKIISKADLVVSLGRGAYEAMSCGKNVLIADWRPYQKSLMDGLITIDNVDKFIKNNCSGRFSAREIKDENDIVREMDKYSIINGEQNRNYALQNLNIEKQVDKMLKLIE